MAAQADASRSRLALLIATSDYSDATLRQLRAPGRDAGDLAEVLGAPQIGGFAVHKLINRRCAELLEAIEDFCADRRPDDQLLIYLSCHGVLDDRGRLYYAATDTRRQRTAATAVAATWLNERLEDCRARSQIVILDCCHSGAFAAAAKGEAELALEQRFEPKGRGRVVLTASRATEYSFEGGELFGDGAQSVFTRAIVEGLRTGAADCDKDGLISVTDVYHYAYDTVRAAEPRQTPGLFLYGAEGDVLLAYSVRGAVIEPVPLPEDLRLTLQSPRRRVRESGVAELAELLDTARPGLILSARQALQQISDEDMPVAAVARAALEASQGAAARAVSQELAARDQRELARQEAQHVVKPKAGERASQEAGARSRAEGAVPIAAGTHRRDKVIHSSVDAHKASDERMTQHPTQRHPSVTGVERGLVALAYLVPIAALITVFQRNLFVRVNAIQALLLTILGATLSACTIGPAYHPTRANPYAPAVSQPWFGFLIALGVTALLGWITLTLFSVFRAFQGKLPRIILLTRICSALAMKWSPGLIVDSLDGRSA
jgi:Caspase domain